MLNNKHQVGSYNLARMGRDLFANGSMIFRPSSETYCTCTSSRRGEHQNMPSAGFPWQPFTFLELMPDFFPHRSSCRLDSTWARLLEKSGAPTLMRDQLFSSGDPMHDKRLRPSPQPRSAGPQARRRHAADNCYLLFSQARAGRTTRQG